MKVSSQMEEERSQLVVTNRGRAAADQPGDLIYYRGGELANDRNKGKLYPPLGTRYKDQGFCEVVHVL